MDTKYLTLDMVANGKHVGDGRIILPGNSALAAFLSASNKNADNAQPIEIQPITEDIDCEIVEQKQLPASE